MRRARKPSLNLSRDRKSTASHVDVRDAQRLLTSTKGLQRGGVAKLTEWGSSSFFTASIFLLLSVLFPHFNNIFSANCGPRRGRANVALYYKICTSGLRGALLYGSLRGNVRQWAALHLNASPGMERKGRLARGTGVWSKTIRFQNEPATEYSDLKYAGKNVIKIHV